MKRIRLQYGTEGLELSTDAPDVTVIEPRFLPGLPDEAGAFRGAVRAPIDARPLRELVRVLKPGGRLVLSEINLRSLQRSLFIGLTNILGRRRHR